MLKTATFKLFATDTVELLAEHLFHFNQPAWGCANPENQMIYDQPIIEKKGRKPG